MISSVAIASLERLFAQSLQQNHPLAEKGDVLMHDLGAEVPNPPQGPRRLVALSISSYLFRIVTLFDFGSESSPVIGDPFTHETDTCTEFVNMICGSVNRGLQGIFAHTGMSTPFVLDRSCGDYVHLLKPTHQRTYEASVEGQSHFRLGVCVCVAPGCTLDFHIEPEAEPMDMGGEIEFF